MFRDRTEAGRLLADRLAQRALERPIVLALPRGGVPVGYEIARVLGAPLDVLVVRKVGAPGQPELGVGALVDGASPVVHLDLELLARLGLREADLAETIRDETVELRRREALYREGRAPIDLAGRTAIVVDDGIATGSTVRAALRSLRRGSPRRIVLAVPVAPAHSLALLAGEADETVCLATPDSFRAVGEFYEDFGQVTDDEVIELLRVQPEIGKRVDKSP